MIVRVPVLLWLSVLLFSGAQGQLQSKYPFDFKLYSTQQGLSHNYTYRCRQDGYGFLWITTLKGLNRFDGNRFVQYLHVPGDSSSLAENDLPALAIDAENRIWTGGKLGINMLDQTTRKVTRLVGQDWPADVTDIMYDSAGACMWVAHRGGITSIRAVGRPVVQQSVSIALDQPPTSIRHLPNGWVLLHVTRRASWAYHPQRRQLRRLEQYQWLTNTLVTSKNQVWLCGWGTGIHQLADTGLQAALSFYPQLDNHGIVCSDVAEAPALTGDTVLWLLGTNTGKMLYHRASQRIIHRFEYKPEWQLGTGVELHNSCYYAPNGTLWVCSWLGLEKIANYSNQFQKGELPALHTVQYNMLSGIQPHASRSGMLWVGIHGSGIALMDGSTGLIEKSWFRVSPLRNEDVYYGKRWIQSLYRDRNGVIWGGSYDGFVRIAGSDVSFVRLSDRNNKSLFGEYSLLDSTGWLWMSCWRGLVGYHPASGQKRVTEVVPLANHKREFPVLEGLATDTQGFKYVGGQFGLLRFKNGLEDSVRLHYLPGGRVERIIGLAVVRQHLVIGSESGLWLYHLGTGQARQVSAAWRPVHAHGMKADWLGNVWIYSAEGLVKYTPASGELSVFTTVDGIYAINSDWATLFHHNGEMYLGHRMAFSRWRPNGVGANSSVPLPMITNVAVNGEVLPLPPFQQQQWVARPLQQRWEFQFTAFEYQQADKLRFAWRLLGFDSSWQYSNNRELVFTNLKAGKYVLEVMAYNSSGLSAKRPARFTFEIPPPWWARPWARVLQVLLLLAAAWGVVKWRERRIVRRAAAENLQTRQLAEMQMATLRSQMNPHFIFNSLNSIQKFIWENKQDDASEYLSKFARLIRQILELSGRELISLRQELDLLKLYVELEHRRCNASFDYQIELADGIDADQLQLPPMLLQPFVENAIWHGLSPLKSRPGLLVIKAALTAQAVLQISIADNGIGRAEAARLKAASSLQRQSVGMQLTERRMQLLSTAMQRTIRYQIDDYFPNETESGTVVSIWL